MQPMRSWTLSGVPRDTEEATNEQILVGESRPDFRSAEKAKWPMKARQLIELQLSDLSGQALPVGNVIIQIQFFVPGELSLRLLCRSDGS